jgi:hypothetical protein
MIHLLVDTSVIIKWFHSEGEAELAEARALRTAHRLSGFDRLPRWRIGTT